MAAKGVDEIETIGTRLIYENRWMRIREDIIRRHDGSSGIYGVVEKPDFVAIVRLESDGRMHLVEQFRYPVRGRYWEIPQVSWEHAPEADPLEVARGELREETGLNAAQLNYAGHLFEACGYSTQGCHVFLATGLARGDAERGQEEQDLLTRVFSISDVESMIREGVIKDAITVAAIGLLRLKGLL